MRRIHGSPSEDIWTDKQWSPVYVSNYFPDLRGQKGDSWKVSLQRLTNTSQDQEVPSIATTRKSQSEDNRKGGCNPPFLEHCELGDQDPALPVHPLRFDTFQRTLPIPPLHCHLYRVS